MVFFNSEMFSVHQSNASSYTLLHWILAETKEYINTLFEFQIAQNAKTFLAFRKHVSSRNTQNIV